MPFRVFTIPGLGFTAEVFANLDVGQAVQHLDWLEPDRRESLQDHAGRMAKTLGPDTDEPVALIGHSFGGILAQEIALHRQIDKIILISSMKSRREIPFQLRILAPLGLHRLFNRQMTLATFRLWGPLFGYAEKHEQAAFRSMVAKQSNAKLQWQLRHLSRWKGVDLPTTVIEAFHGDNDRTLPYTRIEPPVHRIAGGNHMMVLSHHTELNPLLASSLRKI